MPRPGHLAPLPPPDQRRPRRTAAAADPALAADVAARCQAFLAPLLTALDMHLDKRLVRTLAASVPALLRHRNPSQALVLSELGGVLAGPTHAPAGTKRLGRLVHSPKWTAADIGTFLLAQGHAQVLAEAAAVPEGRALCILDGSVLEKPETTAWAGRSPVRSSTARRIARPRPTLGPGYYGGPPRPRPIVVPGLEGLAVLVTGWALPSARRPLTLGAWHWYAKPPAPPAVATAPSAPPRPDAEPPGPEPIPYQTAADAQRAVLAQVVAAWGAAHLLHVWDRGLAGAPWLGEALDQGWHFVVRWKKGNRLRPAEAPSVGNPAATSQQRAADGVKAWQLGQRLRGWSERRLPDPRHADAELIVQFASRPVCLLGRDDPLWLVQVRLRGSHPRRRGDGEPWRLLTTEPADTAERGWRVVVAYLARWLIEELLRLTKHELGIESVRVRGWAPRAKLLAIASLAYAFLVQLLGAGSAPVVAGVLRWAHRTGQRARAAWRPLYRLRAGLAALWDRHPPPVATWL